MPMIFGCVAFNPLDDGSWQAFVLGSNIPALEIAAHLPKPGEGLATGNDLLTQLTDAMRTGDHALIQEYISGQVTEGNLAKVWNGNFVTWLQNNDQLQCADEVIFDASEAIGEGVTLWDENALIEAGAALAGML